MSNYADQRIDTTKEIQLVSDDGAVKITYHHWDMGMKYRVHINMGSKARPRWSIAGYANDYVSVLNTFNRIVSDRAKCSKLFK